MLAPSAVGELLGKKKVTPSNDSRVVNGKASCQEAWKSEGGSIIKADTPDRFPRAVLFLGLG